MNLIKMANALLVQQQQKIALFVLKILANALNAITL